ncbi:hypothetical protein PsorP6_017063 [Peronosclerospora sorghi]|uniref:Uncharacterized protein n=1 Tax=Peronosclerospora sorghi TaxID=230839 RepID=A0ACC0WCZ9_9STRA|nr:hypothetical protein PsorP6_017063 [Peronosclerospora sorghi]
MVRLLEARLSDANANLKVKAANVLATVVTSVGTEIAKMSKLLRPSLIDGVADNKKAMQAAVLHALHQWFFQLLLFVDMAQSFQDILRQLALCITSNELYDVSGGASITEVSCPSIKNASQEWNGGEIEGGEPAPHPSPMGCCFLGAS